MRITHLTLKNWRNFKSVDADIPDRLVIVGPNASGKSNLLDSIRFLRDTSKVGGGFQQAVESRGGIQRVRCLAARSYNHGWVGLEATLGDDSAPEQWRYGLDFNRESRGKHRTLVRREDVAHAGTQLLRRPGPHEEDDEELLTQTALEQVSANREFRPVADFFTGVRYLHLVPQVLRDPGRAGEADEDPFGGDFLKRISRTPEATRRSRLRRINDALRLAVPQLDDLELVRDHDGTPHLQARYQHWRERGARQDERDFSDGTIRLIGLLWALLDTGRHAGPLLLEEPELSLHKSVVRQLPSILARVQRKGGPQVILTTHSSEVLSDPGLGVHEVLVLEPGADGTTAKLARDLEGVEDLLDAQMTLDEIVDPYIEPARVADMPRMTA